MHGLSRSLQTVLTPLEPMAVGYNYGYTWFKHGWPGSMYTHSHIFANIGPTSGHRTYTYKPQPYPTCDVLLTLHTGSALTVVPTATAAQSWG